MRTIAHHQDSERRAMPGKNYSWFHDVLLSGVLKPLEFAVYCVLAKHIDVRTQTCYPSHQTIAREANCCLRSVPEALRGLEAELGLILSSPRYKDGGRLSDLYTLLPVPESGIVRTVRERDATRAGGVMHQVQEGDAPRAEEQDLVNKTQEQDPVNKTPVVLNSVRQPQKTRVSAAQAEPPRKIEPHRSEGPAVVTMLSRDQIRDAEAFDAFLREHVEAGELEASVCERWPGKAALWRRWRDTLPVRRTA